MPQFTDNHGYQLWGYREDGWEHRSDFTQLDVDVEIRDTEANRTQYTPKSGAKFFSVDTGAIYIGTGTEWTQVTTGGGSGETDSLLITPQDLSLVTGEDNTLYHHDGTGTITLVDGSTTSSHGYYMWDAGAPGWVQIAQDADTVDGYHADQLAKLAGDIFTGPLRVDTETEDALLELITAPASLYHPTLHLGGDQDNGLRILYEPDGNMGRIGLVNAGAFSSILRFNHTDQLATMDRVREINIGSFEADTYESTLRVYRNGALIGYIDQSGADLRFKAYDAAASAMLLNTNNEGIEVTPTNRVSLLENDLGDMAKYADDTLPPADTMFWDTTTSELKYKDPNGTNHVLG